jgi:hypothetical protein
MPTEFCGHRIKHYDIADNLVEDILKQKDAIAYLFMMLFKSPQNK